MANPRHLSETNEHYTPPYIVEAARIALDTIGLDPASSSFVNSEIVKATEFFSKEVNGFIQPWFGNVFLNPPGGKCNDFGISSTDNKGNSSQKLWWQKLVSEWKRGSVKSAIFIGFSVEILQTTQVNRVGMIPLEFPMCFPSRRIAYCKSIIDVVTEEEKIVDSTSPPHSSVVVFLPSPDIVGLTIQSYKTSIKRFDEAFSEIGQVVVPYRWMQ